MLKRILGDSRRLVCQNADTVLSSICTTNGGSTLGKSGRHFQTQSRCLNVPSRVRYERFNSSSSQTTKSWMARFFSSPMAMLGSGSLFVYMGVQYASSYQTVPFTQRSHSILTSVEQERKLGIDSFENLKEGLNVLPEQHPACVTVRNIVKRLVKVIDQQPGGGFQDHLLDVEWEVLVVDSPQVNAFVVPGGKIVVYTGLMDILRSKDQLAGVIAHEVAHVIARHGMEQAQLTSIVGRAGVILGLLAALCGLYLPIEFFGVSAALLTLPNSRCNESEADVIGLEIMARACFEPMGIVQGFEAIQRVEEASGGNQTSSLLSTHPLTADRVTALKMRMEHAYSVRQLAGCGGLTDAWTSAQRGFAT